MVAFFTHVVYRKVKMIGLGLVLCIIPLVNLVKLQNYLSFVLLQFTQKQLKKGLRDFGAMSGQEL